MLKELSINNVAVIKEANIDFEEGLNIFTGETGAGKSILIGSISMVLGLRTSKELIRTGEKSASVSALFINVASNISKKIKEYGIDTENNEVLLFREIKSDSSICRINNKTVTTGTLKEIGGLLINIHGQFDTQMLFNNEYHRAFIDTFGLLQEDINNYQTEYKKYTEIKNKLDLMKKSEMERNQKIDLYNYQINEISSAKLTEGEDKELVERRDFIKNAEYLSRMLSDAYGCLYGNNEKEGIISELDNVSTDLENISKVIPSTKVLNEKVLDYRYNLEDIQNEIKDLLDKTEFDENELEDIEDRLDLINRLKKKYGESVSDILSYFSRISSELDTLENFEENLLSLEKEYNDSYKKVLKLAKDLSIKRKESAKKFSISVCKELTELDMPKVKFDVSFSEGDLTESGLDNLEFIISVNPGEDLKPLAKIASGGEMSRIMLAIKNVVSGLDDIGTLVFDEIDAGISGRAAQKVGYKLKCAAKDRQIFCVTHLSQVAAYADNHFLIEKIMTGDKTFTNIKSLDYNGKVNELARIMSGEKINDAAITNAKELLKEININANL